VEAVYVRTVWNIKEITGYHVEILSNVLWCLIIATALACGWVKELTWKFTLLIIALAGA
jgi:hypothetical protein